MNNAQINPKFVRKTGIIEDEIEWIDDDGKKQKDPIRYVKLGWFAEESLMSQHMWFEKNKTRMELAEYNLRSLMLQLKQIGKPEDNFVINRQNLINMPSGLKEALEKKLVRNPLDEKSDAEKKE